MFTLFTDKPTTNLSYLSSNTLHHTHQHCIPLMALQRFNSAGAVPPTSTATPTASRSKSASTKVPRLSNMISLRYEDAVQAEPPIMVTTAKRSKSNSSASSISNASTASTASTSSSSSSNHYTSNRTGGRSRSTRSSAHSTPSPACSAPSSRLSSTTTMTFVSMPASPYTVCSDGSPLPSPTSSSPLPLSISTRGPRVLCSPTLASAAPASPTSPTSPTAPRYPLAIPRPSGLAAPPVEQHPALRGAASPAFRPIVEENGEATESAAVPASCSSATAQRATVAVLPSAMPIVPAICAQQAKRDSVLGSPSNSMVSLDGEKKSDAAPRSPSMGPPSQRSTSYKRPSVSHMKQMIPLKTVEMNLPAPSGPPPQRPPPPVPTRMSKPPTGTSYKRPASQNAVAPQSTAPAVSETASPVAKPVPMPAFVTAPTPAPAPAPAARDKSWRLPKALSFRSGAFHRKKANGTGAPSTLGVTARPGLFLPPATANTQNSPLPSTVEPNQPTKPNASWPPILASPLSHAHSHSLHAPKTNTTSSSAPLIPSASSRPFSSSSFKHTFSTSSASTAVPACTSTGTGTTSRPSSHSTPFSSLTLSLSSLSRPSSSTSTSTPVSTSAAQQKQQQDAPSSPSSTHFFFRVLSMSDARQKKQATEDGKGSKLNDDNGNDHKQTLSPLINTAIPTESLIDDDLFESLTFSKRGSLMFGGKRAVAVASAMATYDAQAALEPVAESSHLRPLAPAVERESFQVRSLYARSGDSGARGLNWEDGRPPSIAVVSPSNGPSSAAAVYGPPLPTTLPLVKTGVY